MKALNLRMVGASRLISLRDSAVVVLLAALMAACSGAEPPMDSEQVSNPEPTSNAEQTSAAESAASGGFVHSSFEVPRLAEAETFKLVPLGPELVKIDYDAYMSSIDHLQKTFSRSSSWPHSGITDEEAMLDMQTEEARFLARESFAYAVLTPDGLRERGCVYVRPSDKAGADAQVLMWVTEEEFEAGFDAELFAWVQRWIAEDWPFVAAAYPGRSVEWSEWDARPDATIETRNKLTAEAFIDAFYSFDSGRLSALLRDADESAASILYYQGWAEGGNYKVLNRGACTAVAADHFRCPITVQDDPVLALNTGFNVTDTFDLHFDGSSLKSIDTSSNDQPIYYEARKWVEANMPEVMEGPCRGRGDADFKGELTPGDCARAMTDGYRKFYAATQEGAGDASAPKEG